jgi:tRNA threonylcarbamoyladenosine biosynthesis protein TsaE
LGELLRGGELILLDGQLGTGKTTFTQGLAQGMRIKEGISSPTFTLLKEYTGALPLYHFDLYRIEEPEEILDLGFEDYFYGDGVCIVEWAGNAEEIWAEEKLQVQLRMVNETKRSLLFTASGVRYCELLRQFQKNTYATVGS